jgi:raffinose/stachyose/melibiose transport system substrate-binding protein
MGGLIVHNKWSKHFSTIVLTGLLIIVGCSTEQSPSSSPSSSSNTSAKTIKGGPLEVGTLWPEGSDNFAAVQRVGDSLVKDFPGTKMTYTFSNTKARPQIELRWKSGDPLDVDNIFNSANVSSHHWVDEGQLKNLTTILKNTKRPDYDGKTWEESILPLFRPFTKYKDEYYAVPDQAIVIGLWYNKKMFDQYDLKPPATWDDLLKVAAALKSKGVDPIAVTGTNNGYMGMWWDYLLQREIGTQAVMDVAWGNKKAADNPGFLRAAQKLQQLVSEGYFLKGFEGMDFTAAQAEFFRGKTGMILMGSWLVGEMKQSIPADFQVGIAPFPTVQGGQGDQKGLFGTLFQWSVAEKSKNPDLSIEYLRRVTAKEEQTKRSHDLGFISPYIGVPTPDTIPGLDGMLKEAANASLTYYYYGIIFDKQRADAWYVPVTQLYFKKATAEQIVQAIDANLARLRGQ